MCRKYLPHEIGTIVKSDPVNTLYSYTGQSTLLGTLDLIGRITVCTAFFFN